MHFTVHGWASRLWFDYLYACRVYTVLFILWPWMVTCSVVRVKSWS